MAENNTLLEKLDGLVARFEEVSTLITDPNVISDQKRYVKLTKEYKELGDLMAARKEYLQCLNGLEEAKMMMSENDPEMKEMAREEAAACEARIPELEEEIKLLLVPSSSFFRSRACTCASVRTIPCSAESFSKARNAVSWTPDRDASKWIVRQTVKQIHLAYAVYCLRASVHMQESR
mgnify:CR=1 FL=1